LRSRNSEAGWFPSEWFSFSSCKQESYVTKRNVHNFNLTSAFATMNKYSFINFHTHVSCEEGHGNNSLSRTRNTSRFSALSDRSAGSIPRPHQARSEIWSLHLVLVRPLGRFSLGVGGRITSPIFSGYSGHVPEPSTVTQISLFGEVFRCLGLYEFHSCALCLEVSHRELFAKIPPLPLLLGMAHFQSLPEIHDHRCMGIRTKTGLNTDSFAVFQSFRFVTTEG